ncbi:S-layer family protein [Candidatus Saccharibacteria bacterium]|nr:S-layer family protein [Candidatus Saccharibacteria bacterium]
MFFQKQNFKIIGYLRKQIGLFVVFVLLLTGLFSYTRVGTPEQVHAATSSNLNIQARLYSASGNIVPDGYYNIEFKMYDASGGGSLLWTETWYDSNGVTAGNDNRVRVVNGYMSVQLGTQTSLPSVNWDDDIWISLNVGGTTQTATPTWDGEMSPRIKLTAVPFAQAARNLRSGNTSTASTNSGNISIQTGNATGATSNSGNITLDVGTATGTAGTISVGTANTSGITIGRVGVITDIAGNLTVSGSQFTNSGSTLNSAQALGNFATGGSIGSAATTVDVDTAFTINQTTAGQTLSLPTPTNTAAGRLVYVLNIGSVSFTMHGVTIPSGYGQIYVWNGSNWLLGASGGGAAITLQSAYDGGNTITSSDARDLSVALADTSTDANFLVNIASGSTSEFKIQANGTDVLQIGSAGQLQLDTQGVTGGILLGGDTNIYRSAANTLKTDDDFAVGNNLTVIASSGNLSTSGNISTTGTGTITSAGLLTGQAGLTVTGAAVNLNASSNFGTSINTGTSTGAVAIGNNTGNTAITIDSGTSAINIGTGNQSRSVNIGTGAGATVQNVTIGSNSSTSTLSLLGGNNSSSISIQAAANGTASINTLNGVTTQIGGTTAGNVLNLRNGSSFSLDGVAGSTYDIGTSTTTGTIAIGGTAQTGTTTFGRSTATNTINLGAVAGSGNTQTINIGTSATGGSTTNINIGSTIAGTTAIQGATTITGRTSGSTTALTVGNSTSTGNIAVFNDNSTAVAIIADGGATSFQNSANSTAAFRIQSADGTTLFNTDTTNSKIDVNSRLSVTADGASSSNLVANPSLESGLTGWNCNVACPPFTFTTTTSWFTAGAQAGWYKVNSAGQGGVNTDTGASGMPVSAGVTYFARADINVIQAHTNGAQIRIDWYNSGGALLSSSSSTAQTGTGVKVLSVNATAPAGAAYASIALGTLVGGPLNDVEFYWDSVSMTSTAAFDVKNSIGTVLFSADTVNMNVNVNGSALFKNQSNSTTAFQIQNAAGTSNLFVADTTNTRIGIGATPANSLLTIGTNIISKWSAT